ncbi:MAG: hypothetical protein DK306_001251 [Chloroflexi bacterium]|nr:MAG: hypothetical protein DK306_001251 [Chloroflexota bacterium]
MRRSNRTATTGLAAALAGLALALLAFMGLPASSAAQAPPDGLWHAPLQSLAESGLEVDGEVRMNFKGTDEELQAFFDVFTELSLRGDEGNDAAIAHEGLEFFRGGPLAGTLLASVDCVNGCADSGAIVTRVRVAASLLTGQGGIQRTLDALDAGELSVAATFRVGDETVTVAGLLLPAVQLVGSAVDVPVPAGLSTLGWCGATTSSEALFGIYPQIESIFVLDPASGRFRAAHSTAPRAARRDLQIEYGTGMFVRTTSNFNIGMPPSLTEALPPNIDVGVNQVEIHLTASIILAANCGDSTTSTQIFDDSDGAERIFTWADGDWNGDRAGLPAGVGQALPIPSGGAFVVFTSGPADLRLPCTTGECNRFFDIDVECRATVEGEARHAVSRRGLR